MAYLVNNAEFLNQLVERFQPTVVKDLTKPVGQQYFVRAQWQEQGTGGVYVCQISFPYYWSQWLAERVISLVLVGSIARERPEIGEEEMEEIRQVGRWLNTKIPRGEM